MSDQARRIRFTLYWFAVMSVIAGGLIMHLWPGAFPQWQITVVVAMCGMNAILFVLLAMRIK